MIFNESELERYIENEFLESSLNETYYDTFSKAMNASSLDDMANVLDESVDFPKFIQEQLGSIISGNNTSLNEEYSGDPDKIKDLKEVLNDVDKQLRWYLGEVDMFEGHLDRLSKEIQGCLKNSKNLQKTLKDCTQAIVSINNWLKTNTKKLSSTVWKRLRKALRSTSSKYGTLSIEEKKKMDAKFAKYQDTIVKKIQPWTAKGSKCKVAFRAIEDLQGIDYDMASLIYKKYWNIYDVFYKECAATYNDITYVRKDLGLEKEGSFFYKVVQKFKRDKAAK